MADSLIFTKDPVTGAKTAVSTANPVPVIPPVKTVMNEMSGLAVALGISTTINLDLGALGPYYTWAAVSEDGLASTGSSMSLQGSSDNVNFYYLPQITSSAISSVGGLSGAMTIMMVRTLGYRYLRGSFYNGSAGVAQTDMYLMLAAG